MQIIINGATQDVDSQTSIQGLIESLSLGNGNIAIELNGEIVSRSLFTETILQPDDKLEIVKAIGGG